MNDDRLPPATAIPIAIILVLLCWITLVLAYRAVMHAIVYGVERL